MPGQFLDDDSTNVLSLVKLVILESATVAQNQPNRFAAQRLAQHMRGNVEISLISHWSRQCGKTPNRAFSHKPTTIISSKGAKGAKGNRPCCGLL